MRNPLHILIHVPLREKRDFRRMLVGLKHALCITQSGATFAYDLLPSFKPRKGQEHRFLEHLAEQISQDWTIVVWDVDRLLGELEQIVNQVRIERPKLAPALDQAWSVISGAVDEQIIDLRSFEKLPNGHYVDVVAAREEIDFDDYPPWRRRRLMAYVPKARPVSEDFWGVLHRVILPKTEAVQAWSSYQRWVRSNRPRPPRPDCPAGDSVTTDDENEPPTSV